MDVTQPFMDRTRPSWIQPIFGFNMMSKTILLKTTIVGPTHLWLHYWLFGDRKKQYLFDYGLPGNCPTLLLDHMWIPKYFANDFIQRIVPKPEKCETLSNEH